MRVQFNGGSFKYACDFCKANFSEQGGDHLSLVIGPRSGLASEPPNALPGWRMTRLLEPQRLHFCLPTADERSCMDQFLFATLVAPSGPLPDYVR